LITFKLRLIKFLILTVLRFLILDQNHLYSTMTKHFCRHCFILFVIGGFAHYLYLAITQNQRFTVNHNFLPLLNVYRWPSLFSDLVLVICGCPFNTKVFYSWLLKVFGNLKHFCMQFWLLRVFCRTHNPCQSRVPSVLIKICKL